jgi:hypothetical protein
MNTRRHSGSWQKRSIRKCQLVLNTLSNLLSEDSTLDTLTRVFYCQCTRWHADRRRRFDRHVDRPQATTGHVQ